MVSWNSASPNGALSVRDNRPPMNQNTTYIETTIGNTASDIAYATTQKDHFFNVSTELDGHHRWLKMPGFTVGGTPTDPGSPLGTGIDGMFYLKNDGRTDSNVTGYYRNVNYIYQVFPVLKTGSVNINDASTYITLTTIPDGVYGEIFLYNASQDTTEFSGQKAIFKSRNGRTQAWALTQLFQGSSSTNSNLKFGNGSEASGLNIRVRLAQTNSAGIWNYILTYRNIP